MKSLFEGHVHLVGKVMDMQLQRQNIVMSNVSNAKTPGYQPLKLEFEEELQAALSSGSRGALARTHEKHFPSAFDANGVASSLDRDLKPRIVHGEDRVNLDKEMALMAKTSLHYNALVTVMQKNFEGLKNIIVEGAK